MPLILPSIFDRLTNVTSAHEGKARDGKIDQMLEEIVKRDIETLLNNRTVPDLHLTKKHPEVTHSIINFGIPDYAHFIRNNTSIREVTQLIKQTILVFEPRIIPDTLEVVPMAEMEHNNNRLSTEYKNKVLPNGAFEFIIRGSICSIDLPVDFQTKINIADGKAVIN